MSKKSSHSTHATSRGRARRRAIEILFESEQREVDPLDGLAARREYTDQVINPYTVEIINGVKAEQRDLDEFLETYAQGRSFERMPGVDRAILRVGLWELLYNDDVPDAVAVSEAANIATEYSAAESPDFINGLLGRLQELKPTLLV